MSLIINKMTQNHAVEVLCWKYDKPYDVYNHVLTSHAILELLSNRYFAVLRQDSAEIIGYFCIGKSAQVTLDDHADVYDEDDSVDIGIGMKPELTGKGNGFEFFSCILRFVEENYSGKNVRLTVASFNKRAIHLYRKFGFLEVKNFKGKDREYIVMKKRIS